MYFVEDNAADAHDNQVKPRGLFGIILCQRDGSPLCESFWLLNTGCVYVFGQSIHGETEAPSFSWTYEEIKEVHKRWWQLRDNAVEIFLTNGRTLLLAFDNTKVRQKHVAWSKNEGSHVVAGELAIQETNAEMNADMNDIQSMFCSGSCFI